MTVRGSPASTRTVRPLEGGTLRLLGPGDIDRLDPAAARPDARQIVRLFSRQLLTHEAVPDLRDWRSVAPVPDVAVDVPSTYNAGLGASHRSYVIHLRPSILWDTSPPRPVTAHDFVRGFKRLCNPLTRSSALPFFRSTIRGMAEFCDGFAAEVPAPTATAGQSAAYQNAHEIPGVFALDDEALVIEVVRASPDFVHMLALTCASAAPVEYDAFLPGAVELTRNLRSNGPYRVVHHVPGRKLRLEPNPVWRQESDLVRHRHVHAVEVTVEAAGPEEIAARLDAGRADLPWGSPLRDSAPGHAAERASTLSWDLDPYLVFNVATGAAALRDVRVRRAVAAAIDRTAVLDLCRRRAGGAGLRVAGSVVPPNNDGHQDAPIDQASPHGDPGLARALLADAGYPGGLELTAVHERGGLQPHAVRACAADLARAGVRLWLVGLDRADFDRLVGDPHAATATDWDIMVHRRSAAWHYRNGRVFLQSMFATGAPGNLGGFSDPEVDDSIRLALEAATEPPATALAAWHAVERRALERAAVVPLLFRAPAVPPRCSPRVRGALPVPALGYACDLTAVWLDEVRPDEAGIHERPPNGHAHDEAAVRLLVREPRDRGAGWISGI